MVDPQKPTISAGARVITSTGPGTCMAVTAYQVQVQPDDGDDPYWTMHRDVEPAPIEDEQAEPSLAELVDAASALLELIRVRLATQPVAPAAVKGGGHADASPA